MQRIARSVVLILMLVVMSIGSVHVVPHRVTSAQSTDSVDRSAMSIAHSPAGSGYWVVGADGGVFAFNAEFYGSMGGQVLEQPVAGIAPTPSGRGYWLVGGDGGVFAFGDAGFYGGMNGTPLNTSVVGMAPTPSGRGYWLVGGDGGVFAFGDAEFHGSMGGQALNLGITGIVPTPSGRGYWLVGGDGGVFAFGDAEFHGSMGGQALHGPIMGMAASSSGDGYWLVGSDGGVFAFGDAEFHGSLADTTLSRPVMGITRTNSGDGYWLVGADGGIFAFGDAGFHGAVDPPLLPPVEPTPPPPGGPVPSSETAQVLDTGIYVHVSILDDVTRLINDSRAAGLALDGGGWRSHERQIELRRAHCGTSHYAIYEMPSSSCSPPTARPGNSMHERGLAVDFTCAGGSISSRNNRCFRWLEANAANYGLYNLPSEPWHWSTNGR